MKVMIFNHLIMMILMLATFMQACSFAPTKKPEGWPSAKKAIRIELHADKNLNVYEGSAHTVPVCVYQLIRPDFFNKLASYPEGLNRLLECRQFHPSVTRIYRLTMQPNEKKRLIWIVTKGSNMLQSQPDTFLKITIK
ncbi:MAG: lipoprotein [Candidatus Magnetoglobus multicellularis str. Araruama]|uniref:Lipoprotein n=1 Tax=Candidatus Magnetoglobus multicellularis str. Araruama TaxID=890399 RepID=A0A1V1PCK7_9BACT|nr:MAG: lipoprotein [Candidatus Magnetoglobus multicellularis str. Araruama]